MAAGREPVGGLRNLAWSPPPSANQFPRKDAQKDINCAFVSFVHLKYALKRLMAKVKHIQYSLKNDNLIH